MLINPGNLIQDFINVLIKHYSINLPNNAITHNLITAPHTPPSLPSGTCAVYVFSMNSRTNAPAGPNRVLKVGKVGPNSGPRFKYQHYKPGSAMSTLAGAISNNRILWKYLGINQNINNYGLWIQQNADRDHFFLSSSLININDLLEVYLKGRLGPVFEG